MIQSYVQKHNILQLQVAQTGKTVPAGWLFLPAIQDSICMLRGAI